MTKNIIINLLLLVSLTLSITLRAQETATKYKVVSSEIPIPFAHISFNNSLKISSNQIGEFQLPSNISFPLTIKIAANGYIIFEKKFNQLIEIPHIIELNKDQTNLQEVVISGTLQEITKNDSPIAIEIYSQKFFKANPTPSLFESLQNINGIKPQINCNVCNTGDIHINGLEGPYTMVLIDGMPIVSGLSTVYGLNGIPQSLVDRIELIKGPASTLYGSEAVGGLINVITKSTQSAPKLSTDAFVSSWGELNLDVAAKFRIQKKTESLIGVNYFNYQIPFDFNKDNFTDLTLQHRISVFNKWNFKRKSNRTFQLAGRYIYENRWGGEMDWTPTFRGTDSIYGESIYTQRWEFMGTYQLPLKEIINFQWSFNGHNQNSVYGDMTFLAQQYIGFGQFTWHKNIGINQLLAGATLRYTYYDDNTAITQYSDSSQFSPHTFLPGIFLQNEIKMHSSHSLLLGIRYDWNSIHGSIFTPRLNYKWSSKNKGSTLRFSLGNGYRVANVFTEDHMALTGSRKVEFTEALKPENSWNGNLNFIQNIYGKKNWRLQLDASAFYTYFTNKIIADYDSDPTKVIYNNLDGHAVSRGFSLNIDFDLYQRLKLILGATYMDVFSVENQSKITPLFTEKIMGTWTLSYTFEKLGIQIDYTGNLHAPMRLPIQHELDPRKSKSPWFSLQNIQITKKFKNRIEIYGGVKNLLNFTPNKGNPFIIARSFDPFDKDVQFDSNGQAMVTNTNPYGLSFDPTYAYAPNQGIRGFLGIRWTLK